MEKREKGRARRWLIRLCSAALVALMVLPVLPDAVVLPASAVTQAEINQMKEDAAALKKQRADPGGQEQGPGPEGLTGAADQCDPGGDQQHCGPDHPV